MKKVIFVIIIVIISIFVYINVNASVVIPSGAIRVRVVPNSNDVYDQEMKQKVKDYVSGYIYLKLKDVDDVREARQIIKGNISGLNAGIKKIFEKQI